MAGVYRRGDTWTIVYDLHPGAGRRRRKQKTEGGFRTKKIAEQVRAERIAAIRGGSYVAPSSRTFAEEVESWERVARARYSPTALATRMSHLRANLLPALGPRRLQAITPEVIEQLWHDLLDRGLSGVTIRAVASTLSQVLRRAVSQGRLRTNPALGVRVPGVTAPGEMTPLTAAQADTLVRQATESDPRLGAFVMVALGTGMRVGEILGLGWDEVDFEERRITVAWQVVPVKGRGIQRTDQLKTTKSRRTIAMTRLAEAGLRLAKKVQAQQRLAAGPAWKNEGVVFTSANGSLLWRNAVALPLGRLVEDGVAKGWWSRFRIHDLRHTFATLALARLGERSVKDLSDWLGHSDVTITLRTYCHATTEGRHEIGRALDEALGG